MPDRRFADPPITEVVCGVWFAPVSGLDPVLTGRFWAQHKERFPKKQLQPAVRAPSPEGIVLDLSGVPALRTWLVSGDDTRVMQIQSDRFYLNWRSQGGAYASFNRRGAEAGLLAEVLEAFSSFARFMSVDGEQQLEVAKIEMTMIDLLVHGRHWGDPSDLAVLLPSMGPFLRSPERIPDSLLVQFDGGTEGHELRVVIQRAKIRATGQDVIRLETTVRLDVASVDLLQPQFVKAHGLLKAEFDRIVSKDEHYRFDSSDWRPGPR